LALALACEGDQRLAAGQDAEAVAAYEKALCHGKGVAGGSGCQL